LKELEALKEGSMTEILLAQSLLLSFHQRVKRRQGC
jgi:hypothetical protein